MPYEDEIPPWSNFVEPPKELDESARLAIGAAIAVHRVLGPGLPEDVYQRAMEVELRAREIPFEAQKVVTVHYRGVAVGTGKIDLLISGRLVVEIKSVASVLPVHRLQTLTYMRIIHESLGLLINFNVPVLKEGIKRIIESETP